MHAFRPHLSMGLALQESSDDFVRLPQAEASGRQRCGILRQAHFITTSEKGVSEPNNAGQVENYTESGDLQSQQDSFRGSRAITETILASWVGK